MGRMNLKSFCVSRHLARPGGMGVCWNLFLSVSVFSCPPTVYLANPTFNPFFATKVCFLPSLVAPPPNPFFQKNKQPPVLTHPPLKQGAQNYSVWKIWLYHRLRNCCVSSCFPRLPTAPFASFAIRGCWVGANKFSTFLRFCPTWSGSHEL